MGSTSERGVYQATSNALNALDLLRAFWTIYNIHGSFSISWGTHKKKRMGVVHLGPVHTLHHPDGSLAVDDYWYQPEYTEDLKLFEPKGGWHEVDEFRKWAMRKLKMHPFREDVESLMMRYVSALDFEDPDISFLQLWALLEKITDTVGENYDKTIDRTIWPYHERKIAKESLEQFRFRRNLYVHGAKSAGQVDEITQILREFVERHLTYLIQNLFKANSLKEHGEFLATPTNLKRLGFLVDRYKLAARFQSQLQD